MSTEELHALWREVMGRALPPSPGNGRGQRRFMIRDLAWTIQEREHGGLDPETQRLLNAAVREAMRSWKDRAQSSRRTVKRVSRTLPTASRLVRTYRGTRHEVEVLGPSRFRYREREYRSLTAIAREITGAECSGPRFFGLTSRKGTKA